MICKCEITNLEICPMMSTTSDEEFHASEEGVCGVAVKYRPDTRHG